MKFVIKKIHEFSKVGTINGLWANHMGQGGIIPIEASFFPSGTFLDLKLTGMQGDVMKESMIVAKTLALSKIDKKTYSKLIKPEELKSFIEKNKMKTIDLTGLVFNPLIAEWALNKNRTKINYFFTAEKI